MIGIGLHDMFDQGIAHELGVDVATYVDIIENKCTYEEADFIIEAFFQDKDIDKAKALFNSKLHG